ncbi:MAG: DEAD/DEAH box helicase [Bacteroidetes bacterium]|jgi:SNF2 family DNA or RNA helicase|nr:DEAD/DEAH box helicase [Bacteroidota bacterium]MBT6685522.1 DEAD/DEAH box helicase [Bacteroidota bacterium]MBT7144977.1 DEAD/DEAH box helicase [Bacteroidota bacterium]MBT7492473.1 DEAD/DEAH box helicase [Bacteroidota bacterium]
MKFVVAITKHHILGLIPRSFFIEKEKDSGFYKIAAKFDNYSSENQNFPLSKIQKKIVDLLNSISEKDIHKLFSKKKVGIRDFINSLNDEIITKQIRPYIEIRINKVIEILKNEDIPLFLKDRNSDVVYNDDRIQIQKNEAKTVFNFHRSDDETTYFLKIRQDNKEISLTTYSLQILTILPCCIIFQNKLYFFSDIDGNKLKPFVKKTFLSVPKSAEKKFFETFVFNCIKKYRVNASGFEIETIKTQPKAILSVEKDLSGNIVLLLKFEYDKLFSVHLNTKSEIYLKFYDNNSNFNFKKFVRNLDSEKAYLQILKKLNLVVFNSVFLAKKSSKSDALIKNSELIFWLSENSEKLKTLGFEIVQDKIPLKYNIAKISLNIAVENRKDWFDIFAIVKIGKYKIPFVRFRKHILNNKREFFLPNGEVLILPAEWFEKYKEFLLFGEREGDTFKLKNHYFQILDDFEGINKNYLSKFRKLSRNGKLSQETIPKKINAELRQYQKDGYTWLCYLKNNCFGGVLADDMGLGKTLQTITLLCRLKENWKPKKTIKINQPVQLNLFEPVYQQFEQSATKDTSLIIVPTSLIHNWENEIRKFAPSLKVLKYAGANGEKRKELIGKFANFDIVLTSYGLLRNDIEFLEDFIFFYLILDESHNIKNPLSKLYSAIIKIKSQYKLALTGTPIQNSLIDLYAQINFLNPGLLGSLSFFKRKFEIPIINAEDENQQKRLQALISPFILRRKKEDVAKDLPELTETVRYCTMTDMQNAIYEAEKNKIRNYIFENISKFGKEKTSFLILAGLTKLRQLANHPSLIDEKYEHDSGKYNEVLDMIESLMSENHKVLIFSSFVKHLNLFEDYFIRNNLEYSYLKGDTSQQKRESTIKKFQQNENNMLFLISIKAGGEGLNLTASDYIFILDPWWNPAVENQAIARAHRIGQDKKVFVYRFISINSIEEKIRKLQESKSKLSEVFVNSNNPFKNIKIEDIESFFA